MDNLGGLEPSALIDTATLAKVTASKPPLWEKYRRLGGGPCYIRLGGPVRGAIRYRVADVLAWLESRAVRAKRTEAPS